MCCSMGAQYLRGVPPRLTQEAHERCILHSSCTSAIVPSASPQLVQIWACDRSKYVQSSRTATVVTRWSSEQWSEVSCLIDSCHVYGKKLPGNLLCSSKLFGIWEAAVLIRGPGPSFSDFSHAKMPPPFQTGGCSSSGKSTSGVCLLTAELHSCQSGLEESELLHNWWGHWGRCPVEEQGKERAKKWKGAEGQPPAKPAWGRWERTVRP